MIQCNGYFAERELHKVQQISFSQDREYGGRWFLGFDLHTMWGLYADKGYGVCLVFDKDRLVLEDGDYANDVRYFDIIPQYAPIDNRSRLGIRDEIWRKKEEIYFRKRKEWEYEQEYRVIRRAKSEDVTEYLDISKSLSFAIICKDILCDSYDNMFESETYLKLYLLNKRLPILLYEFGLDGYSLYNEEMDPIWTEQLGFM